MSADTKKDPNQPDGTPITDPDELRVATALISAHPQVDKKLRELISPLSWEQQDKILALLATHTQQLREELKKAIGEDEVYDESQCEEDDADHFGETLLEAYVMGKNDEKERLRNILTALGGSNE